MYNSASILNDEHLNLLIRLTFVYIFQVKVLYVRNLALCTTEQSLRELFGSLGGTIERVKKMKDYAFVHFSTREEAEKAKKKYHGKHHRYFYHPIRLLIHSTQGHMMDGCEIDVNWSKPVANREEYQQRKAASKAMLSGTTLQAVIPATTLGLPG